MEGAAGLTPQALVRFIHAHRWTSLSNEKALQQAIADQLAAAGASFEREVLLGPKDRIDFLAGPIGIEVKVKGARLKIFKQCERYCGYERIGSLVLVTAVAMSLPARILGKPAFVASLGRGWL